MGLLYKALICSRPTQVLAAVQGRAGVGVSRLHFSYALTVSVSPGVRVHVTASAKGLISDPITNAQWLYSGTAIYQVPLIPPTFMVPPPPHS